MVAVLLVVGAACGGNDGPRPAAPQVVEVTLRDHRIVHEATIGAGRTVFTVHNRGRVDHDLFLLELPEDFPPLDAQLRGSERRVVPTIARIQRRRPGATGTFAVDLRPGRYGLLCSVTDADGRSHAQKGMSAEFRVGGPEA